MAFSDEDQDIEREEQGEEEADISDILMEKLESAFHTSTAQIVASEVAKIAIEHDPIDLAHVVTHLPLSARYLVYENLPDLPAQMIFMIHIGINTRASIFRHLSDEEIKHLVEKMPPDEAVDVLDALPCRRLRRVTDSLEPQKQMRIRELQKHGRKTAGRLMTNEFFAFPLMKTIGEVSEAVRENPGIELTRSVFVLNEDEELIGFVPARNLIVNPDHLTIKQVMQPVLHSVGPEEDREEVVDLVERYKIDALPVIDDKDHLLGVISYEDVVEVMEDIADERFASIAGTAEKLSEHEPLLKRFFSRAPWLIVTLCAGLTTSTGMALFKDFFWFSILPFFTPLIAGMSGNVGLQCSTVFVRGMATGEITPGSKKETIKRELTIGSFIGLVFGILCGLFIYLLNVYGIQSFEIEPLIVGIVVGTGMTSACFTATFLGTFAPLFFSRIGIDPAVASGPIVTACNDVISTFMFIFVSRYMFLALHGQ